MSEIFIHIVSFLILVAICLLVQDSMRKIFLYRFKQKISIFVGIFFLTLSLVLLFVLSYNIATLICSYVIIGIVIGFIYKVSFLQMLAATSFIYFQCICAHLLVLNIFALMAEASTFALINNTFIYAIVKLCSACFIFGFICIEKYMHVLKNISYLLENKLKLKLYASLQIATNVFCLALSFSCFKEIAETALYIYCIVTLCFLAFITIINMLYCLKSSRFYEIEMKTEIYEQQLKRQLEHYESYRAYTESMQEFKHDYNKMMTTVQTLLMQKKYVEAKILIDQIDEKMQTNVSLHKKYCNNHIIDAILYDLSNKCKEASIDFECTLYLPEAVNISEMDCCRLFSNIFDNAVEACEKLPKTDRKIDISSALKNHWVVITIENAFNGELLRKNDRYFSTKKEKNMHGYGLKNAECTITSLGGFMTVVPDFEKKIFRISLNLPLSTNVDAD